jgi:hypothetical protein
MGAVWAIPLVALLGVACQGQAGQAGSGAAPSAATAPAVSVPSTPQTTKEASMTEVDTRPIGTATLNADGSLSLQLRAEGAGGMMGDAFFTYQPGDAMYKKVLDHVGGLKAGESKPVPPFPEK